MHALWQLNSVRVLLRQLHLFELVTRGQLGVDARVDRQDVELS